MTLASSAIPLYFYPYEKDGKFYTSGDNIAASPAMYAMQHAIDRQKQKLEDVRVINVGGLSNLPNTISTEASLLEWIKRLSSLFKPSKTHTMKYQAAEMLQVNEHAFYDFKWPITSEDWDKLYMRDKRKGRLE